MEGVYNEIGVGELIMRGGSCEGSDGKAGGLTSGPFALLHRMSVVVPERKVHSGTILDCGLPWRDMTGICFYRSNSSQA